MFGFAGCLQPVGESSADAAVADSGVPDSGVDAGTSDAGQTEAALLGLAKEDCAPNDAPMWTLTFSDTALACDVGLADRFYASLWRGTLTPGTYAVGKDDPAPAGTSCLCGIVANLAKKGTVTLDSVTTTEVTGRIDAVFSFGEELHRTFKLVVCPSRRQCG